MRPCHGLAKMSQMSSKSIYDKMFMSGLEKQYDLGRISSQEFGNRIIDSLGLSLDIKEVRRLWEDIFWPVPGMEDLIRHLTGRYELVLLSNTNEWHFNHCFNQFPVVGYFNHYVLSYREGLRKPQQAIYQRAINLAGTRPQECLYIDDIREYVEAAEEVGIHGILFKDVDQLKSEMQVLGIL